MKVYKVFTLAWIIFAGAALSAEEHQHHPKHNMVLVGEREVFASHLVYKFPHNFQVILKLTLDKVVLNKYLAARAQAPNNLLIFLLNPMDISQIKSADSLTGGLLSETPSGERSEIVKEITLDKRAFQVLYFDEVPLSLAGESVAR